MLLFFVKVRHTHLLLNVIGQCVVFGCILFCLVFSGKDGGPIAYGLTICPSIGQAVFQSNLSILVSYHSFSKVEWWSNLVTIETGITLFKMVELCQKAIQSKNPLYKELFLPFTRQPCRQHNQFCYHFNTCIFIITSLIDSTQFLVD